MSFTFNICKDVTQELARTHFLHPLDGMTEFSSLLDPKYLNSILLFSEIDGKQIWLRSHNNFKYAYANLSEDCALFIIGIPKAIRKRCTSGMRTASGRLVCSFLEKGNEIPDNPIPIKEQIEHVEHMETRRSQLKSNDKIDFIEKEYEPPSSSSLEKLPIYTQYLNIIKFTNCFLYTQEVLRKHRNQNSKIDTDKFIDLIVNNVNDYFPFEDVRKNTLCNSLKEIRMAILKAIDAVTISLGYVDQTVVFDLLKTMSINATKSLVNAAIEQLIETGDLDIEYNDSVRRLKLTLKGKESARKEYFGSRDNFEIQQQMETDSFDVPSIESEMHVDNPAGEMNSSTNDISDN